MNFHKWLALRGFFGGSTGSGSAGGGSTGGGSTGDGSHNPVQYVYDDTDRAWFNHSSYYAYTGYCPNCGCLLSTDSESKVKTLCPCCNASILYDNGNVTFDDGSGDSGEYSNLATVTLDYLNVYVQLTDEAKMLMGDCTGATCYITMHNEETGREYDEQHTSFDPDGYASLYYEDYDGSIMASCYNFYATVSFDCGGSIVTCKSNSYYFP